MAKKISQVKIAQELGVSQSLVSIVLNGRKEGIAKSTYDRIWNYALQHGYSPKGMKLPEGSGLPATGMQAVGYFLRAPLRLANKSNFFSHVTQGLHDYLREQHVNVVFLGSELDYDPEEFHRVGWQKKHLMGVVVMGEVQPEFLAAVREMKRPLVYVSARSHGMCHSVNANEYQSAEQLVDHLFDHGHRHFAFLCSQLPKIRNEERLKALRQALARHRLHLPDEAIFSLEEAERTEGHQVAGDLLHSGLDPFPTAWICVNGLMARGAVGRLYQEGLKPAIDISVAAFDSTRVCSEEFPVITSASSSPEDLGREAGRILLQPELHEGDSLLDVVLPSHFIPRDSTGAVNPELASRLRTLSPTVS